MSPLGSKLFVIDVNKQRTFAVVRSMPIKQVSILDR